MFGWRMREYNTAADLLANLALADNLAVHECFDDQLAYAMLEPGTKWQVHTDGGLQGNNGSYACTVTRVGGEGNHERTIVAHARGPVLEPVSPFATEMIAVDIAVNLIRNMLETYTHTTS